MATFVPEVDPASEFLEISNDFTDPKEIIREGISNAFDAGASEIEIQAVIDKTSGEDELVITIIDNGHGMDEDEIKQFFGLGYSTRRTKDKLGQKASGAIGEKGHGTKIYFNSRKIEVASTKDGMRIDAYMEDSRKKLRSGAMPEVTYSIAASNKSKNGTKVIIYGYNNNISAGFGHEELKDYILWFTKFGSVEKEFGVSKFNDVILRLSGLGKRSYEPLIFGHRFAPEKNNITELRKIDRVTPLDWYVAKWVFPNEEIIGYPGKFIDFVFYIEGDQAKRNYNKMIHQKHAHWKPGEYNVEERYGLWLCKDYFAIFRRNTWVSEKSEWTKYHAFVNCQEFSLTANRADLNNTPAQLMEAIEKTVKEIFEQRIETSAPFKKYKEELDKQQQFKNAKQEEEDFARRKKAALAKKSAALNGHTLLEPRQEGGVFSLFLQITTLSPELFDFKIIDYDTGSGYDLLVTQDTTLDLNRAALRFVEMKYELQRQFSHSFKKLTAIICWDTKLSNQDEVEDLTGAKRTMKITAKDHSDPESYTKYMLVSDTETHNIEVFVLKDFLKEKLGLDFRPI